MLPSEIIAVYCETHSVGKMKFLILTASGTSVNSYNWASNS